MLINYYKSDVFVCNGEKEIENIIIIICSI